MVLPADPKAARALVRRLDRLRRGLYHVVDKVGQTVRYRPNAPQRIIRRIKHRLRKAGRPVRLIILKGRQMGITTGEVMDAFDDVYWHENRRALLMSHLVPTVQSILGKAQYAYDHLPSGLVIPTQYQSKNQIYWPRTNSFLEATTDPTGRTIDRLHICEVALIPRAGERIPQWIEGVHRQGEIVKESTAYGIGGYFHETWEEGYAHRHNPGPGHYVPIFLPWTLCPEYALPELCPLDPPPTDEERELQILHGLSEAQLAFRRFKIGEYNGQVELFRQYYPLTPAEAFISSGLPVFDQEAILRRLARKQEPLERRPYRGGELRVYRKRDIRAEYLIAADPSEGDGRDNTAAVVLDTKRFEVAAVYQGKIEPNDLGHYLARLGTWYNGAEIAVERNNHGHSVLNTLDNQVGYSKIYRHRDYDQLGNLARAKKGFPTNVKTRPLILDDLAEAIRGDLVIPDEATLMECLKFQVIDGKPQAPAGAHDDLVLALAIAAHLRKGVRKRRGEYPHDVTTKPPGF